MTIEWKTHILYDGDVKTFDFDGSIQGYFVGISGFQVEFKEADNHVETIGVELEPSKISDSSIQVKAFVELTDKGNANGEYDYCWVFVTTVVWLGESSEYAFLNTAKDLQSTNVEFSNIQNAFGSAACLSSLKLNHDGDDHQVSEIAATVDALEGPDSILVSGSAEMEDQSSNEANVDNLAAGVIAPLDANPGFEIRLASSTQGETDYGHDNDQVEVTFDRDVLEAVPIISSFDCSYDNDEHNLKGLTVGAMVYNSSEGTYSGPPNGISYDGNKVTFTSNVSMYDYSDNETDTNNSVYLVIAKTETSKRRLAPKGLAAPRPRRRRRNKEDKK